MWLLYAAIVGGSVAWGHGSSDIGRLDFGAKFFQYIRDTYPHPDHVFTNAGMPGTHSGYMAMCVNWHVPRDVDLVVVSIPTRPWGANRNLHMQGLRTSTPGCQPLLTFAAAV